MKPFQRPLLAWDGLARSMVRRGNPASEDAAVEYILGRNRHLLRAFDAIESAAPQGFTYQRSTLFAFHVVALVCRLDLRAAHARMQSSDRLRRRCHLPPAPPEVLAALEGATGTEVVEAGFPSRRLVAGFLGWLGDSEEGVAALRRATFEQSLRDAIRDHEVDLHKLVGDGTRVLSCRRGDTGSRIDHGAVWIKHDDEPSRLVRNKVSVLGVDIPLVLASAVGSAHEVRLFEDEALPNLTGLSLALVGRAPTDAAHLGALAGASLAGDRHFAGEKQVAAMHRHALLDLSRPVDHPQRAVVGTRKLKSRSGEVRTFDVTNDGALLCPCDADAPLYERLPCRQDSQGNRARNAAWVRCSHANTPLPPAAAQFSMPFRKPDTILYGGDVVVDGESTLTLHHHLPHFDVRAHGIRHKSEEAVEHYHAGLFEQFGLNIKDRRGARRVLGDGPIRVLYLIGDLLWNTLVLWNADRMKRSGEDRRVLDPHDLAEAGFRKALTVRKRKGKKKSQDRLPPLLGPPRLPVAAGATPPAFRLAA